MKSMSQFCVNVCVSARERVRSVHHVDNTDSYLHTCIYAAQHYVIRVLLIARCSFTASQSGYWETLISN